MDAAALSTDTGGQRIVIRPVREGVRRPAPDDGAWATNVVDFKPKAAPAAAPSDQDGAWAAAVPDHSPEVEKAAKTQARETGTGESIATGAANAMSFGTHPAIRGLMSAAGAPDTAPADVPTLIHGAAKLFHEQVIQPLLGQNAGGLMGQITGQGGPATEAYQRGREAAHKDEALQREQHPVAFLMGQLAGSLGTPAFGAMQAGGLGARALGGVVAGGIGGGLQGAGEAVSAGQGPPDVATSAAKGAGLGAATGGVLGAAIGPRLAGTGPGARAATTAQGLGSPLPRGVASDNPLMQATTAKLQSLPLGGERISQRVNETGQAAGRSLEDIAQTMAGGATDRAAADAIVRPGLEAVIDRNRQRADAGYNALRSQIDLNQRFTMPRTDATLTRIMAARQAAGHVNPAAGLEQFRNVAAGATFNGAHRARVDAREAGNPLVPHPGYNAGDFNQIVRAMTADIRDMVRRGARGNPQQAIDAFDRAETEFGRIAQENGLLHRLLQSRGEGVISALLGAAKEKGGNLRLLAQLRNTMAPADFHTIGGVLLHELGHNNATGQFSLAKFVTEIDKLSRGIGRGAAPSRALQTLFSPAHLNHIQEIANLGTHVKGALRETNTSHTAGVLILFDLARDAILLGATAAAGTMTGATAATAAGGGAAWLFMRWLASPANAGAMAAFSRAYRNLGIHPNPARLAAFNVATRNLSNTIGVPVENILRAAKQRADNPGDGLQ